MYNLFCEYLERAEKLEKRCEELRRKLEMPCDYQKRKELRARISALEDEIMEILRDASDINSYLKEKKDLHFPK